MGRDIYIDLVPELGAMYASTCSSSDNIYAFQYVYIGNGNFGFQMGKSSYTKSNIFNQSTDNSSLVFYNPNVSGNYFQIDTGNGISPAIFFNEGDTWETFAQRTVTPLDLCYTRNTDGYMSDRYALIKSPYSSGGTVGTCVVNYYTWSSSGAYWGRSADAIIYVTSREANDFVSPTDLIIPGHIYSAKKYQK